MRFRLVARDRKGKLIPLVNAGQEYLIDGQPITVVGLADLGKKAKTYDECYQEDSENQIDIILSGSAKAAKSPRHIVSVINGLVDPMRTTYNAG